ncbi:MAG TPA: potassium channel family protein [Burkholderiales bacterium]|nr:potassium channel family protein [Burkholderiales bacterium]
MTTVGYGDITPHTPLGRALAALMMLIGWGILAVPTGIVTAEMTAQRFGVRRASARRCSSCGCDRHDDDARYCRKCGIALADPGGDATD